MRKQSADVVKLLRHVTSEVSAEYYMFMEDDIEMCANGINIFKYLVDKVFACVFEL